MCLQSIEAVLGRSKYISQIYVHGNAARSELVAVIVPDADALLEWCRAKNISKTSIHDMCAHPKVVDLYIKEIQKQAKNGLLRDWEFPKSVFFEVDFNTLGQGFTVDNETMTPTMKLKRESLEMRPGCRASSRTSRNLPFCHEMPRSITKCLVLSRNASF